MKKKFLAITHRSFADLHVASYEELWKKAQAEGYKGIALSLVSEFTKAEDKPNKFHAIFSSASEDRHGDVVQQDFDLKSFKKNPVFLDSHSYWSIEDIIGRVAKISVKDGKLQGDIEFAVDNPKGALAMKLAEGGFLSATSIGFIPREFNDKGHIIKSELLEVSAVSVPANADALFEKSVEPTTPEEEPAPAPQEEEPAPEPTEEVAEKASRKAIAAKVIAEMAADQKTTLRSIAKAVQELNDENKNQKKRQIFKAVRSLLNE